jgi:hypothetical protein
VLAGQKLGIREVDDGIWLVSFMTYDLAYIDLAQRTLQTIDNPFGTRSSPVSQVRSVTQVSGPDESARWRRVSAQSTGSILVCQWIREMQAILSTNGATRPRSVCRGAFFVPIDRDGATIRAKLALL